MANTLRKIINTEGITQADLSRESGVNTTTITNICNNSTKNNVREVTKGKIAKAINRIIKENKYTAESIFK